MPVDVSVILTELAPMLNAASVADSDFLFWTQAELYQLADDTIKELARKTLCFATAPPPIALAALPAATALPAGTIAVIYAAFNSVGLRDSNVPELEALDDNWDAAEGTPKRWVEDLGLASMRLYPNPPSAGSLALIVQAFPAAISNTQTLVEAPAPFAGFLLEAIIGRARAKQGDAMQPEVAEHCAQRAAMYEGIFAQYWGGGE